MSAYYYYYYYYYYYLDNQTVAAIRLHPKCFLKALVYNNFAHPYEFVFLFFYETCFLFVCLFANRACVNMTNSMIMYMQAATRCRQM